MHLAYVKSDQPTAVRRVSCLLSFTKIVPILATFLLKTTVIFTPLCFHFKPVRNAMAQVLFWIFLTVCSLSLTISARRPRRVCWTNSVVGLEFTLDAVVAAFVQYDNGITLETRRFEGSDEYKALKWRWFEMSEEINNGTLLPSKVL
jgi:hypothetical protein